MCFFIKLGRHVSHIEKIDPIDFGGHRSKFKVTIALYEKMLVCFFIELSRRVNNDEMMIPIDFGGHRSKVKVTRDIYGNKLVNTMETKP